MSGGCLSFTPIGGGGGSGSLTYKGGYNPVTDTPKLQVTPIDTGVGDHYTITAAGTFFGENMEIGDVIISEVVNATALGDWTRLQKNLDAASIKTLYESNADTNAFTDAEQSKLSGIEAGANVAPLSTGLLNGGVLSIGTDTAKFDISIMVGLIVDNHTDPENPAVTVISEALRDEVTVTNLATQARTFISINSSGTIIQRAIEADASEIRDEIALGILVHPNGTSIDTVVNRPVTRVDADLTLIDLARTVGAMNVNGGNIISPNGANLNLDVNAGEQFRVGSNFQTDKQSPNLTTQAADTALTFAYRYQDGSGGFTQDATTTVIDPDQYDDGSGTLAAVANNKFTIQKAHMFASGTIRIQYGQNIYDSLADAEAAAVGEVFNTDPNLLDNALFRASIIVKKGTAALNDVALAKFLIAGKFGLSEGSGLSTSTTSLQKAYDNSPQPEILTDATRGAVDFRRGSALDTDDVFTVQNGAGGTTFSVDGNGNIVLSGTVDGRDVDADGTKLDGIETAATADQTGAEIKTAYEAEANAYTDTKDTKLAGIEALADVTDEANVKSSLDGATITGVTVATGDKVLIQDIDDSDNLKTVTAQDIANLAPAAPTEFADNVFRIQDNADATKEIAFEASSITTLTTRTITMADEDINLGTNQTKLDGIETSATADQTGAEIKTAYEAEANAYTDTKDTKLAGIETAATADQTGAEIKTAYEAEANAYTDTKDTKLAGIETAATADQTDAEIETAYNAQVGAMSQATAETGTSTTVERVTAERIAQAIAKQATFFIQIPCSDLTTSIGIATDVGFDRMPAAGTLIGVRAAFLTAPTGSVATIDIHKNGTTVLSTKITVDATEETSETAATPAVISVSAFADDDKITIDFDGVGSTEPGKGVVVTLIFERT